MEAGRPQGMGWGTGLHHADRPQSALSTASTISCTDSVAFSASTFSNTSCGDDCAEVGATSDTLKHEEDCRPCSASGNIASKDGADFIHDALQVGVVRRSKSTSSLQRQLQQEGRRTLWGWGQRPLLPPPHFYYCPHAPPRNLELRHEDIPEGVDRVKSIKAQIESPFKCPSKGRETIERHRTLTGGVATSDVFAYSRHRTTAFGGSTTQLNFRSSSRPENDVTGYTGLESGVDPSVPSWRSTLPRSGVQSMYWNGISRVGGRTNKNEDNAEIKATNKVGGEEDGEVRVSASTLERIRARGSSVTYYGGMVVKQGPPSDPTMAIMEEINRQRAADENRRAGDHAGGRDSSYGSAESTPTPSMAPTPPPPPSRSPSPAKVVSAVAKKVVEVDETRWNGKCSVVFDFSGGNRSVVEWGDGRIRDAGREGGKVCF